MPPTKKSNWTYNDKETTLMSQMPKSTYGFVYQIEIQLNGSKLFYIGRKQLISRRKKMMSKKEIEALTNKRLKKYYNKKNNEKSFFLNLLLLSQFKLK